MVHIPIMAKKTSIPVFSLESGIRIRQLDYRDVELHSPPTNLAHRDNNYIFLFQESGTTRMMVDFHELSATGRCTLCILPGQVHHALSVNKTKAWFLAINTELVSNTYRPVFEEYISLYKPVPVSEAEGHSLKKCFSLLVQEDGRQNGKFGEQVMRSLADACIGMFAAAYYNNEQSGAPSNHRTTIITRQFRVLLRHSYRTMKSPSAYAAALNISLSYLNEAVKFTTGLSVTHWIQQEIIIEAKRMLYYTNNTAKEIGYELGYEDHTYFTRLFTKAVGMSPLAFRKKYRE